MSALVAQLARCGRRVRERSIRVRKSEALLAMTLVALGAVVIWLAPTMDPGVNADPGQAELWLLQMLGTATAVAVLTWLGYSVVQYRPAGTEAHLQDALFPPIEAVADQVAREVNRARRSDQPLSVVAFRFEGSESECLELMDQLGLAGLRDTDVWAYDRQRHEILAVTPETDQYQARQMVERLATELAVRAAARTGYAIAEFPQDGLTLESLLETARRQPIASLLVAARALDGARDGARERVMGRAS